MNVVGYARVSSRMQQESGLGMDAQHRSITSETTRRGWHLVGVCTDEGVSAAAATRPGLSAALAHLAAGEADALVVAKLDRLARSTLAFAELLATATRGGWAVVSLDLGVDMTTPSGRLVANVMACVAEWERDAIRARTTEALAAAKARGTRLGRPRLIDPALLARIVDLRADGATHRQIAAALTAAGLPTPTGRTTWHPSTIGGYLASAALDPLEVA